MEKRGLEILITKISPGLAVNKADSILTGSIRLPPLYKLFTDIFILGQEQFNYDRYKLENDDRYHSCQIFFYGPRGAEENNITFTHFDTLNDVLNNWDKKLGYTEENVSLGLLRVGGIALGGGLFVGINPHNLDQIFLEIWDSEEGIVKLEENIFLFAANLKLIPDDGILKGGIVHTKLYKNWNEDYWRVKV